MFSGSGEGLVGLTREDFGGVKFLKKKNVMRRKEHDLLERERQLLTNR